jgi:hypothetical protein
MVEFLDIIDGAGMCIESRPSSWLVSGFSGDGER